MHPENWRRIPLADLVDIASGQVDPREAPWSGMLHIGGENIIGGTGEISGVRRAGDIGLISGKYPFGPDDLLYSKIRPALNKVACPDFSGICSADIYPLRPRVGQMDRAYLARLLRSADFLSYAEKHSTRTNIPKINREALLAYTPLVPPLVEQRRIADILDKADAIRRKRKEAIVLTEELLRSAFLEMFGDPVTNLKGWPVVALTTLGTVTTGNTPSRDIPEYFGDAIEWIKSDNINTPGHYLTRAAEGLSKEGLAVGRMAPAGSTLMTCIAGSPECIGNVGLADRDIAFNQQINAVTPRTGVDHRFLYVLLLLSKRLVQGASTNSMKGMVSKGKLEQVLLPAPPGKQQTKFGEIFDRVLALDAKARRAEASCADLFGALVQRAFRGELTRGTKPHKAQLELFANPGAE